MKKGSFRKVLGIAAVLVALGVVVMIALSPRAEGFCPELFTPGRGAAQQPPSPPLPQPESEPVRISKAVYDSLPSAEGPVSDTLMVE